MKDFIIPDTVDPRAEEAAFWYLCLTEGSLTETEQAQFDNWLAVPENADVFADMARMSRALDGLAEEPEIISLRTAALCDYEDRDNQGRRRGEVRRSLFVVALAASLLLGFLGILSVLGTRSQHYVTGIGEQRVVLLDDGSQLALDGDSAVDVDLGHYRRSLVLTRGRARFNVAKDPLRPFTVTAGNRIVVATGTSFSVELLGKAVHVQLFEGHVAVVNRTAGRGIEQNERFRPRRLATQPQLTPGNEMVALAEGSEPPKVAAFQMAAGEAWQDGELIFENETLADAVARVNRYSRQRIEIADEQTGALVVNGVFRAGDAGAFVDGVSALYPVRIRAADGGWRIGKR
ncbi:FecR family protein [Novosphingobium sp.]|jgi:transmembrane sensor|uniref:FecR family protein n=1 Tax=Novosphingobium sp. TaxID=1874826 RepID=UPI002FE277B9